MDDRRLAPAIGGGVDASGFSALIVPGGFGAAKNLCNHATVAQGDASKLEIDAGVKEAIEAFSKAGKPIGLCCIAPVIAAAEPTGGLTDAQIALLNTKDFKEGEKTDEDYCQVCFDEFADGTKVIVLSCSGNHMYHEECILASLKRENMCQACKEPAIKF